MRQAKHPATGHPAIGTFRRPIPTGRRFMLRVLDGPDTGRVWDSPGATCGLGSDPSNDLVLADSTVCRHHCQLVWSGAGPRARDLGSHIGTFLDGVKIHDAVPREGSLLKLGDSVIRFEAVNSDPPSAVSAAERFGHLIGRSVAMRTVFAALERAAGSTATVLIEGETGTGKEAAARSLHDGGARRAGPYIRLSERFSGWILGAASPDRDGCRRSRA